MQCLSVKSWFPQVQTECQERQGTLPGCQDWMLQYSLSIGSSSRRQFKRAFIRSKSWWKRLMPFEVACQSKFGKMAPNLPNPENPDLGHFDQLFRELPSGSKKDPDELGV